jgi:hypothetical protein
VNSKNLLQSLSSFEDNTVDISYIPFSYKKITSHNKHEQDYRPEILFPIVLKVQVSENGFIYPVEKPIIPRDLLLPLDKEDFFIGCMDNYDLFVTLNDTPIFEFSETSEWEKYYSDNIETRYEKGLIDYLLEESIIDEEQAKEDCKKLINALVKSETKKKFISILVEYNGKWDKTIEDQLTDDAGFNNAIESYISKWDDYMQYITNLLDKVIENREVFDGYQKTNSAYFSNGEIDISSKITAVYEDIYTRDTDPNLDLFRNYTTVEEESEIPVIDSNAYFSARLGHNNNEYPLADAQRTAVSALVGAKNGEILPVNGPPGTGKTTMLLSVVACLWVEKAVEETDPPVIIANSTNNQAVTNIIDAFAKDFSRGDGDFAGRWIDEVGSFGSYFVSSMRSAEAREKGYITEDVVKEMETEDFFIKAKQSFLEKSHKAFQNKDITIEESVRKLHKLLLEKKHLLKDIERTYENYHHLGKHINETFKIDYKSKDAIEKFSETLSENKKDIETIEDKWERYLASESIFLSALSFLPFVRKKRNLKAKIYAKENKFSKHFHVDNMDAEGFLSDIKNKKEMIFANIQRCDVFRKTLNECCDALNKLDNIDPNAEFIEIDRKADTKIRFEMFLIATHYWEGQWLLQMETMIEKGQLDKTSWKYENICKNNWRRRMKITPCAVMTSYMLPNYFSFSRKIHDNLKKGDYLYDFIDLLIVDEAGQVPPEVAGAGFSLAKKALVIGDTKQIPPISKLTKSIDIGNLQKANLISINKNIDQIDKAYKVLQEKGTASDGGSVMKISQNRSKYYPEKELERGLYLYEHRRCYDNIIAFCNELCYKGILKPMRGVVKENAFSLRWAI